MSNTMKNVQCKSLLTKSNLPEVDYCVNPYVGCLHRCVYCYARFMRRFTGHAGDEWGHFVDVKENAPSVLREELRCRKVEGMLLLGSVTDAYQPAEEKYGITRACLEILAEYDVPISILTKSKLVLRDIDLLTKFSNCEVGLTIEFSDDRFSSIVSPGASSISERVLTLGRLRERGIRTYAFMGPIMPGLTDCEEIIRMIASKIDYLMAESLNLGCGNKAAIIAMLERHFPDLLEEYRRGFSKGYWDIVRRDVEATCVDNEVVLKGFFSH